MRLGGYKRKLLGKRMDAGKLPGNWNLAAHALVLAWTLSGTLRLDQYNA